MDAGRSPNADSPWSFWNRLITMVKLKKKCLKKILEKRNNLNFLEDLRVILIMMFSTTHWRMPVWKLQTWSRVKRCSWEELDKFKCLEAKCREKTLEKSGLKPTAPNRLADRKHCALSTQPNPHLPTARRGNKHYLSSSPSLSVCVSRGEFAVGLPFCIPHIPHFTLAPNVGLEPTTLRLRVSCSTDWASHPDKCLLSTDNALNKCVHCLQIVNYFWNLFV